ncbi:NAD(P)/FAD-dependent oxidoreductase [Natronoglycomyces albus]|nr:FAD-dependent oxidoreductase [Natronoglycomyces albus]
MTSRSQVAVIGSGVSGLTAAYVLQQSRDVTLFEADHRLGGHAHTHTVVDRDPELTHEVDSGFLVHNRTTYPRLVRLFTELDIKTQPTQMSMSIRCEGCGLEYCGSRGIRGVFAHPRSFVDPRFHAMLWQMPLFYRRARRLLATETDAEEQTLGQFLSQGHYSQYFVNHFVIPLVSAVWSCGPHAVRDYPARYLFTFLANHGMLAVLGNPAWRTVVGGSRTYVERVAAGLHEVRTGSAVTSLQRHHDGVSVRTADQAVSEFDAVVIATHPDQALRLLEDPTVEEKDVLGSFEYSRNETVLHTDTRWLPRRAAARGSWNYLLSDCRPTEGQVQVSYHLNRLQRLTAATDYVVTLGAADRIDHSHVLRRMTYEHPIYTPTSVAAQRQLPGLNDGTTAFAGAYHGWGFHEDGCQSGVNAAQSLGVRW